MIRFSSLAAALLAGGAAAQTQTQTQTENEFDCLIEARQQVDVRASAEGVIESVLVRRGDQVKKGALLAKLSSGPEQATVNLARSRAVMEGEIKAAEARVDLAKKKWERADELAKRNFVSANAKDEAEAELRLASEQLRALRESRQLAELELKRAEEVLAQRSIYSPVNGVVVVLFLKPGELTGSNQKDPILKLSEINPLHVELVLPVKEFGKIKRGQSARVLPEPPIGGSYQAKVDVVDLTIDAASGTFGVRLLLPNPQNRIPAGVKCRARF